MPPYLDGDDPVVVLGGGLEAVDVRGDDLNVGQAAFLKEEKSTVSPRS
jgi:hypothetical protein